MGTSTAHHPIDLHRRSRARANRTTHATIVHARPRPDVCRLFVLQARDQPIAVILRRGPARWHGLIRWRTDTDTFEAGEPLNGQIDPDLCDLSPDGAHLLYYANHLSWNRPRLTYNDCVWAHAALSQPPHFRAVTIWARSFGAVWLTGAGGLFLANNQILLNMFADEIASKPMPAGFHVTTPSIEALPTFSVTDVRLRLAGWHVASTDVDGDRDRRQRIASRMDQQGELTIIEQRLLLRCAQRRLPAVFRDRFPPAWAPFVHHPWNRWDSHTRSYTVVDRQHRRCRPAPNDVTWMDWDHRNRLLFARQGRLFHLDPGARSWADARELADFNRY